MRNQEQPAIRIEDRTFTMPAMAEAYARGWNAVVALKPAKLRRAVAVPGPEDDEVTVMDREDALDAGLWDEDFDNLAPTDQWLLGRGLRAPMALSIGVAR